MTAIGVVAGVAVGWSRAQADQRPGPGQRHGLGHRRQLASATIAALVGALAGAGAAALFLAVRAAHAQDPFLAARAPASRDLTHRMPA